MPVILLPRQQNFWSRSKMVLTPSQNITGPITGKSLVRTKCATHVESTYTTILAKHFPDTFLHHQSVHRKRMGFSQCFVIFLKVIYVHTCPVATLKTGVPKLSPSVYPFSISTDEHVPLNMSTRRFFSREGPIVDFPEVGKIFLQGEQMWQNFIFTSRN